MSARAQVSSEAVGGPVVLAVVVAGLTIAAVFRRGAIHDADAALVGAVSAGVLVVCLLRGIDRLAARVVVPLGGLAAWWMASACVHGTPVRFLPFGASILGFLAAFLVVRDLADGDRAVAGAALVGIGALSAAVGLVAEAVRSFPLAERAQHLWRVSTTLTYSNAAGLLFAMALLVAVGLDVNRRTVRLGVCLCTAGLVASQSRGAALALVIGALVVPWGNVRAALRPLVLGLAAGMVAVATSSGDGSQPVVIVAMLLCSGTAFVLGPGGGRWRTSRRRVVAALGVATVALAAAGVALRVPIERRLNQDRSPEWAAAVRQWQHAPLLGVGPDKPLVIVAATHTVTPFAQSEYLQVLAGTGLLGEALLVASGVGVASVLSRRDALAAGGAAAVLAFAVAGAVDFVWHVPALALFAGAAGGLSSRPFHALNLQSSGEQLR